MSEGQKGLPMKYLCRRAYQNRVYLVKYQGIPYFYRAAAGPINFGFRSFECGSREEDKQTQPDSR